MLQRSANTADVNGSAFKGRPRNTPKHQAAIDAARELFASDGLYATSMDAIAQKAGVAKVTLYSHFEDKNALYVAVVRQLGSRRVPGDVFELQDKETFSGRLSKIAEAVFDFSMAPESTQLIRLLTGSERSASDLSQLFWDSGSDLLLSKLAAFFAQAWTRRKQETHLPRKAAELFYFSLIGEAFLRKAMGLPFDLTPLQRREHLDSVVTLFTNELHR
ncbi:MAG: TetR family transcriptional regulator [Hydrocarboniphaga sp.]|uniref:TetR/AcrR family transcriptional regulator n=1 Tax=Hydrocarboniphaga sp. TaxID=2033016 RepID=UPI002606D1C8|nr:TetR/AcrR family transcriptional regulator [Hydrocarboniphaga sp.]MDB5971154.1 TetR family transcriptional regulator [Hydrocarboniphaga sp.]